MKRLLIILTILVSGVVSAQGSPPTDADPEVVFEFVCEINPLELTDEEIQNFPDRDALLQALVGLTTNNGNVVTKVIYPPSTTVFIVKVTVGNSSVFPNTSGFGKELILDEMLPENFREFYKYILNYIITNL